MLFKLNEIIKKTNNLMLPHKGVVVFNNDPKKLNRVKCTIEGILEETNTDKLPWVSPRLSNSSPSGTSTKPPEIGTELWVEFPLGADSLYQPIYKGYWYSKKNGIANPENSSSSIFGVDYPDAYGEQDSTGNYYFVNKKQESIDMEHSSGDHLRITRNGDVFLSGQHNINVENKGELNVNNVGKINIVTSSSDIAISSTAGAINITALSKTVVKGTVGVDVIGSLVKLAPDTSVAGGLTPVLNGVITGVTPCILAGIPHALGSPTTLST